MLAAEDPAVLVDVTVVAIELLAGTWGSLEESQSQQTQDR